MESRFQQPNNTLVPARKSEALFARGTAWALGEQMRRGVLLSAVCVLLVAAIGWLLGGLPLRIVVDGSHATAHMELLGEYPNDVKLIELEQLATSQVVWRTVAAREMVQLHHVPLVVGVN